MVCAKAFEILMELSTHSGQLDQLWNRTDFGVAIKGVPVAIDSTMLRGNPSDKDGRTVTSADE